MIPQRKQILWRFFIVLLVSGGLLPVAPAAHAATFNTTIEDTYWCYFNTSTRYTDPNCDTVQVEIALDKSTYAPGENMVATGRMSLYNAKSGSNDLLTYHGFGFTWELAYHRDYLTATVNGIQKEIFNLPYGLSWEAPSPPYCTKTYTALPLFVNCPSSGTATFTAPTTPGTYTMTCNAFLGQGMSAYYGGDDAYTATITPPTCSVTYTVASSNLIPELRAKDTTAVPSLALTGQTVDFFAQVSNVGTATSEDFPSVFQVVNSQKSATLAWVSGGTTTALAPGASSQISGSFVTSSVGIYYVRACANANSSGQFNIVPEQSWINDCDAWTAVSVANGPLPDLTAGPVTPTTATVGVSQQFSAPISNIGTDKTGAGFTNLMQRADSLDAKGDGVNVKDLGTWKRGTSLGKNKTAIAKVSYTFPSEGVSTTPYTRYLRFCADKSSATDAGVISELNEENKCGAWTQISVDDPTVTNGGGGDTRIDGVCGTATYTCDAGTPQQELPSGGYYVWDCLGSGTGHTDAMGCKALQDTGDGGSQSPTATITALPTRVREGGTAKITWSAQNATDCWVSKTTATGGTIQTWRTGVSGTDVVDTINEQTIYKISCAGAANLDSATVNIRPIPNEF
ncbi:hypothetical protein COU19_00065 [Candidatus Kaiserbacteria bacterium CG10_big_fil_rev_8_21_14_0_10_56_12]|uniref:CARDB domain-containing protein n=1 Tax=Candidatus Kaiserbacteria bacterium CG10_big_fil_rev_8_21_14_0_10_56_12 TaxID=1974611 RepID=A0A2H0UAN4_9BACT|nr:MAG: hypothetical protein COU19_00065 [Candidatus Kaiserbacteria bacterium CG10_big_fil_rev_8_21_14_0_10_56_12]